MKQEKKSPQMEIVFSLKFFWIIILEMGENNASKPEGMDTNKQQNITGSYEDKSIVL